MSIGSSGESTAPATPGSPVGGFLDVLRTVALIAAAAGAAGSIAFMLRAGRRSPRLLIALFTIWVLSPFVALAWANMVSKRWSFVTRATLYCVTLVVTLGSLATYGDLFLRPPGTAAAFFFVAVPPASWLLMTIVGAIAALRARRLSHRGAGGNGPEPR